MDKGWPVYIVIAVLLLAFLGMWLAWRRRTRRDADLVPPAPPAEAGVVRASEEVLYVATTAHDAPLERLAVRGLAFRARAVLTVHESGFELRMPGEEPVFVPRSAIASVGTARVAIDRVVERGGLVRVAWRLGDTVVDSYLRAVDESSDLLRALGALTTESEA